ncbi:glycosyltransferase family 2 protein [Rhizobium sp. L80/93]|uniref:glycosyltransferase family 2 protein n=1 Tax=Rhizobium sp. E27B/91 TaxID=2819995 RepID=UPI001ADBF81E|nr:glycosyltransferase family 2 protein [Rhizobium sp. E27B/91]
MKVTVYLPTKNRLELFKQALLSIQSQTYSDIEIIVIDDGSEDGTLEYLNEQTKLDDRIVAIVNRVSQGAARARNKAILHASGEFITGLDDDDQFAPDRVSSLLGAWQTLNAMGGEMPVALFTDSLIGKPGQLRATTDRKDTVVFLDLFRHNYVGNQVFCETSTLRNVGGFDESMPALEDLELWMRLLKDGGRMVRCAGHSYVCLIDDRPRISSNKKNHIIATKHIFMKHGSNIKNAEANLYMQLFSPFYGFTASRSEIMQMLRCRPPIDILLRFFRSLSRNIIVKIKTKNT